MAKALTIRTETALTADHDPVERWDAAVSRYLETRKGGRRETRRRPITPEMVKVFIHKPRVKQLSPRDILDTSEVRGMLKVQVGRRPDMPEHNSL
jgi:hypothetical protein